MKIKTFILASLILPLSLLASLEERYQTNKIQQEFEHLMNQFRQKPAPNNQVKIHNMVAIVGEEPVKISGFGIVSGLNGTGDAGSAATKMLINVAKEQGLRLNLTDLSSKNLALVSISANVSPHQKNFDVSVKSINDSKSLQNGFLEASTLSPIGSSEIYALASGSIALGARYFEAQGKTATPGASSVTIGHPTSGFVLNGGELIKPIPMQRLVDNTLTLFVKFPSNRTATNIANTINNYMGNIGISASPLSASEISVHLPDHYRGRRGEITRLIADIGDLSSSIGRKAIITIDQGSGVVAMTEGVKMEPGSIAVAGLTVTVTSDITPVTRQGAFSGQTSFYDNPQLEVAQSNANFLTVPAGTDLRTVQETLNALKLSPTSIISVFTAMHQAGMIHADLRVIPK